MQLGTYIIDFFSKRNKDNLIYQFDLGFS
jgi:hypothetical protein